MQTQVKDVMTAEVVAIEENTSFKDIVNVMYRHRVGAVPVLDSTGQVRGVVSESDLLFKETAPNPDDRMHVSPARRAEQRKAAGVVATDLMTAPALTVASTATVEDAAGLMRRHKVNQLPVIDVLSGKLVGIVGRADVLAVYRRPDADILRDVVDEVIVKEFALEPDRFKVTVDNGRVVIEGTLERRSQISLLMRAIRYVEGVVSATPRLSYEVDDSYLQYGPAAF